MVYIINGTINYNPTAGTLFSPDNHLDLLHLLRISNELLRLLIEHNRSPLSREFLLYELWEKHGLSASSNNLNNYVSMLRKALEQCGGTGLIVTIPKHGFRFEADIEQIADPVEPPAPASSIEPVRLPPQTPKESSEITLAQPASRKHFAVVKLLFFVVTAIIILLVPDVYEAYRVDRVRGEVLRVDQCRFYVADEDTRISDDQAVVTRIKTLIGNEKIDCSRATNGYYFIDTARDAAGHRINDELLSICPFGSHSPCNNYMLRSHVNEE